MPAKEDIPPLKGTDDTVHLDVGFSILEFILDLVTGSVDSPHRYVHTFDRREYPSSYDEVERILEFGARYEFIQLPRLMLPIMHKFADEAPWAIFTFAANNDFPILAAHAIGRLARDDDYQHMTVFDVDELFADIPSKYTVPLIRNMTLFRKDDGAADWEKAACNFPHIRESLSVSSASSSELTKGAGGAEGATLPVRLVS